MIAAEVVEGRSVPLTPQPPLPIASLGEGEKIAIVFGNENAGVLEETLDYVDHIIHIPMQGVKESLNVGQAAAIFMREMGKMSEDKSEDFKRLAKS